MDRARIQSSITAWQRFYREARDSVITRASDAAIPKTGMALALLGLRRSGKTHHAINLSKQFKPEEVFFYNFEDPLFLEDNSTRQLTELLSVAEEYGEPRLLILDEIQNITGWERWVRSSIDQKRYQIIVTGSSAKLLDSSLATSLTGRCLAYTIWPLSLSEFQKFTAGEIINSKTALTRILKYGALPEVALQPDPKLKEKILDQYLTDILFKDVVSRASIRNTRVLRQIATYYFTNTSSLHSHSAISKAFRVTTDMVANITEALKESNLIFEVDRYHKSLKVQSRDSRKIYVIDPGLRNIGARSASEDLGKLLENLVFLELKRQGKAVNYFKEEFETDFVITTHYKPEALIQVCATGLSDEKTRLREIRALEESMGALSLKRSTIVTLDREEKIQCRNGKLIEVVQAHKWLDQIVS